MLRRALLLALLVLSYGSAQADLKFTWKNVISTKKNRWEAKARFPQFQGTSAVVKLANANISKVARADLADFLKYAKEPRPAGMPSSWEFDSESEVAYTSASLISLNLRTYNYSGGAHPNTSFTLLNYGIVGGRAKRLQLSDVVLRPKDLMGGLVLEKLNAVKKSRDIEALTSIDAEYANAFLVTRSGITWMFQPYAVGAYVEGAYEIKCSWAELAGYVRPNGPLKELVK